MNICVYPYTYLYMDIYVRVCVLLGRTFWHLSIYSWCYNVSVLYYLAVMFICNPHCFNLMSAKSIFMKYIWHPECVPLSCCGRGHLWHSGIDLGFWQAFLVYGHRNPDYLPEGFQASFWYEETTRRTPAVLHGIEM